MKRICSLFLMLLLVCSLAVHALAAEERPLVVDQAGLMTQEQVDDLAVRAEAVGARYQMDVVILTANTLGGKSPDDYADDFFDGNGYGKGEKDSGIIFLLAMQERQWQVVAYGTAADCMSGREAEASGEAVVSYLSDGEYYNGFLEWLSILPDYMEGAPAEGQPNFVVSLIIGAVVALIVVLIMRSAMNTKRQQASARHYLVPGTYHLSVVQDFYLYSRVTKTARPKSNGSSGGGRSRSSGGGRF